MKTSYKPPDTTSGALRTPVVFYEYLPSSGPEPGKQQKNELFKCFAEVYNPSMKDIQLMDHMGTKEAVTIKIRDTKSEYNPTNKHFVEINDYRYKDKTLNVIDVRPDLQNNNFVTLLLGVVS